MAKNSIRDYDATSGNNTDVQSVDISEGCAASGINNAIREVMADLKDVSTGAVNLETPAADRLDVDNIRIDGNTISSTDTNGDITVSPDGTAQLEVTPGGSSEGKIAIRDGKGDTVTSGATSSSLLFTARDSSIRTLAQIDAVHTTTNGTAGDLKISTRGGDTLSERLRIDSSGNLLHQRTSNTISGTSVNKMTLGDGTGQYGVIVDVGSGSGYYGFARGGTYNSRIRYDYTSNFMAFDVNSSERMRISGNKVMIGTSSVTSPSSKAGISFIDDNVNARTIVRTACNSTAATTLVDFINGNGYVGSIVTSGSSTAYNTSSDHRLKENVADMTGAIDRVKALAPKRFNFIADADTTVDGFLAHEAQAVVPEAVTGTHNEVDEDGNAVMQGIDQSKLVPLLTGALKEAITKIETLETEMTALKARVTALEDA